MKSDMSDMPYFEFEERGLKTTRRFEDDLFFSYNVAADALSDWGKKHYEFEIKEIQNKVIKITYLKDEE